MSEFKLPEDLKYNRGAIQDPAKLIKETGSVSWLFLCGDEFVAMPKGMSYQQVQQATTASLCIVSDPPRVLNLDLAKKQIEALEKLSGLKQISCRFGPRASAVAYMYVGVNHGATYEEYEEWDRQYLESLKGYTPN